MKIPRKFQVLFALAAIFAANNFLAISIMPPAFADEEIENLKAQMRVMNETIQQLQQTITQMQGVIEKYEQKTVTSELPPGSVSEESVGYAALNSEIEDLKNDVSKFIKINGYYDFEWYNDDKEASPSEFKQHNFSLFFDKRIEQWHLFTEVEYEFAPKIEGDGTTVTGEGEIMVETAWLEYNHNDLLTWRAGKLILPQYWSAHHYPSLMVSTSDPLMVKRVFPFNTTGVSAYGTHYLENEWGGSYNLFVGNGESAVSSGHDVNENKIFGGKLTAHIPWFERFDLGASTYMGENASNQYEYMWGIENQMTIKDFELLTELAYNTNGGGSNGAEFGYYIQPSYRFLPKWTTFYRFDSRDDNTKIDDPDDSTRHTVGLRYQPISAISLKGELFRDTPDDSTLERFNGILSSVVIFF